MAQAELTKKYELVAIGGSAGSLEVVRQMLAGLRAFRFAIVIVVHRMNSPDSMLSTMFSSTADVAVKEPEDKEPIVAGKVYLAPADYHLLIEKDRIFSLDASEKVNFSRPSIDVTFESAADAYGPSLAGIVLSGGNSDGAQGLLQIKNSGGLCVVQKPDSAAVSLMPSTAINLVKPHRVLDGNNLGPFLAAL